LEADKINRFKIIWDIGNKSTDISLLWAAAAHTGSMQGKAKHTASDSWAYFFSLHSLTVCHWQRLKPAWA